MPMPNWVIYGSVLVQSTLTIRIGLKIVHPQPLVDTVQSLAPAKFNKNMKQLNKSNIMKMNFLTLLGWTVFTSIGVLCLILISHRLILMEILYLTVMGTGADYQFMFFWLVTPLAHRPFGSFIYTPMTPLARDPTALPHRVVASGVPH